MRQSLRLLLLSACVGGAMLPGAGFAQMQPPPAGTPQLQTPPGVPPIDGPGIGPANRRQEAIASVADTEAADDAIKNLRAAREAVVAGRDVMARELLERAESRVLTRSTPASRPLDQPVERGPVARIAAARAALQAHDNPQATSAIDAAIVQLERRQMY